MRLFGSVLAWFLRAARTSRSDLVLENLALRQQLATYARSQKRPRIKPEERAFWVALSRAWGGCVPSLKQRCRVPATLLTNSRMTFPLVSIRCSRSLRPLGPITTPTQLCL